ncbi:hypothetical protein oki361_23310 [Helicobacter pylori]
MLNLSFLLFEKLLTKIGGTIEEKLNIIFKIFLKMYFFEKLLINEKIQKNELKTIKLVVNNTIKYKKLYKLFLNAINIKIVAIAAIIIFNTLNRALRNKNFEINIVLLFEYIEFNI